MNWNEFLAHVRIDLQDDSTTPRWSDKLLWMYTCDAIRDYSGWFSKRIDSVPLVEVDGSYRLPSDFVDEIAVENPLGVYLKRRQEFPGFRLLQRSKTYHIEGERISLDYPSDGQVYLTYYAVHDLPVSEEDVNFVFTVPMRDMELLRIYVKARVHEQMRGKTARLDRFKSGSGNRDDNPLTPEFKDLMLEYQEKLAERCAGRTVSLYRVGRYGN